MKIHLIINPDLKLNDIYYDFDCHCLRSLEFRSDISISESAIISDEVILQHVLIYIRKFYNGPIFYCDDDSFSYGVMK